MKKIMAIVLVAAMIMAVMPVAFAAPAVKTAEKISAADKKFESNASVSGEMLSFGRTSRGGQTTINPQSIDKKYQTLDKTKGWMEDIELGGFGIVDPAEAASTGYWLTEEKEAWTLCSDNPAFDGDAYGMCAVPADEAGVYRYAKGEMMWFNFDLYQSFNTSTGELISLTDRKDGYGVSTWIYAGHMEDESYPLIGAWSSAQGGLSISLTAPDDDYVYMIYIFVEKVDEFAQGWGGWYTLSTADINVRDAQKGAEMKVGESITDTINTSGKLIAAPINEAFVPEYGQVHKIQLEGNKKYALNHTSDGTVYVHLMFLNENMDVIAEMAAIDDGGEHNAMKVFPTESGTYYVAAFGLTMEDEGDVTLEVLEFDDFVSEPWPEIDVTIDASEFGSEEIQGTVDDILVWDYYDGVLQIGGLPGNYKLVGDASDVVVIAYDGARLVMDNAQAKAMIAMNSYAPVSIEAKGESSFANPEGYCLLNEEGYLAGVYIVGDTFRIENCIFGIVLEGAPITLAAKKVIVDSSSMDGYYPIAMWVMGNNLPSVGLGKNAKFDGNNRVSKMSYDPDGNFTYGYAISEHEELYRPSQDGFGWDEGVLYFELTTDGMGPNTAGLVGDANGDGKVNTGDATQVLKYAAGMITLEGEALANADTNGDGKVNTGDATMILKFAAGMITEFPVH